MSAIASLTAPVAVKAGKSAAFSRGTRVSQVRAHADSRTTRGLDRTRRHQNLIRDRARAEDRRPRDRRSSHAALLTSISRFDSRIRHAKFA